MNLEQFENYLIPLRRIVLENERLRMQAFEMKRFLILSKVEGFDLDQSNIDFDKIEVSINIDKYKIYTPGNETRVSGILTFEELPKLQPCTPLP